MHPADRVDATRQPVGKPFPSGLRGQMKKNHIPSNPPSMSCRRVWLGVGGRAFVGASWGPEAIFFLIVIIIKYHDYDDYDFL